MAVTSCGEFHELLVKSGLISSGDLPAARKITESTADPREAAKRLVTQGHLTKWQAQQLLAGKHQLFLGKYKLLDKLGEGGMGAVYKAEQTGMGRLVAVKVMSQDVLKDEGAAGRFHREIRSVSALNHPNIIAAIDADQQGAAHYLVMEYVAGRDLKAWIEEYGRLPVDWACECIRQAALGLQHAHEKGLVHRDIKPGNLLVVGSDTDNLPHIKVLDMGLARFTSEAQCTQLTKTGQVLGTIDYISPEQARDTKGADIRADVFSLGCTLFRMLTGEVPYGGRNPVEKLMARAMKDAPPIRSLCPDLPPTLERVVAKMLARKPDDRYQTPKEVADAMVPFAAGTAGASEASSNLNLPAGHRAEVGPGSTFEGQADQTLNVFLSGLSEAPAESLAPVQTQEPRESRPSASVPADVGRGVNRPLLIGGGLAAVIAVAAAVFVLTRGGPDLEALAKKQTPAKTTETRPVSETKAGPGKQPPVIAAAEPQGTGSALEFDGKDDYVEIPSLQIVKGEPRTIECWMSLGPAARHRFFDMLGDGASLALDLVPEHSNWTVFGKPMNSGNTGFYSAVHPLADGPLHVAVQFDTTQGVHPWMFVNGKLLDGPKKAFGFKLPARTGAVLGSSHPNAEGKRESFFSGRFHQVRVSRSLRYSRAFTPPERFEKDADTLALYRFNEGTGGDLKDSSGNGHDGKIVGAKWVKSDATRSASPAQAGRYALQYDGNAKVEVKSLAVPATGDLTFEAYVNHNEAVTKNLAIIVGARGSSSLYAVANKWLAIIHGQAKVVTVETAAEYNRRVHLASVRSRGKLRLFVDGNLIAEKEDDQGELKDPAGSFVVGDTGFVGALSEVRVSKAARYDKNFIPDPRLEPDKDTLALYHFDEGTGDVLKDSSGHGHDGKIVGAKWVSGIAQQPATATPAGDSPARLTFAGQGLIQADATHPFEVATLTVEALACPSGPGTYNGSGDSQAGHLFRNGVEFDGAISLQYDRSRDGKFYWRFGGYSKKREGFFAPSLEPLEFGRTVHVAGVLTSKDIQFFVDGRRQGEPRAITHFSPAQVVPFVLGGSHLQKGTFVGELQAFKLSRTVRYLEDFTPPTRLTSDADTLALYHCDEGQGELLRDASGNKRHGKIAGAKWVRGVAPKEPAAFAEKTWERAVNLMPLVDPAKDAASGAVKPIDGGLRLETAVLVFPYRAPEEYDLRVSFTPRTPSPESWIRLASPQSNFALMMGAWGNKITGFRGLDLNAPSNAKREKWFEQGKRCTVMIQVRRGSATAFWEGERVCEFTGDLRQLNLGTHRLKDPACLGMHTQQSIDLHSAEVIEITGQGSFTRPEDRAAKEAAARREAESGTFTNALGMEFVRVPKGKSWLGGTAGKPGEKVVEFAEDFYLGKYEVTQEEWQKVMGNNPAAFSRNHATGMKGISDADLKRFPLEFVSWDTCQEFVAKLNEQAKDTGWTYRLPTIAEWEYACRGGPLANPDESGFDYYAGEPSNTLLPDQARFSDKAGMPCKVGSYPANRLGLCDMHGNVWEWCGDVLEKQPGRFLRGGCYSDHPKVCRVTTPNLQPTTFKSSGAGLRVARVRTAAPEK